MKKFSVYFCLIFSLFFNTNLQASTNKDLKTFKGCNSEISQEHLQKIDKIKIEKIEIDTHNYRNWTVNSIRILIGNSRFTDDKYKRRFDATLTVSYEGGLKCIFDARIRHSGDAKDHIALQGNSIIQSIDVNLNDGNIRGITKFKLFRPNARGVLDDVIIQTQLLRDFEYLAPRSIKVNARINQAESIMLFQEKAAKELLEFNNRREGPILEGDQKFFFKLVEDIPYDQSSNWSVGTPVLRSKSIKAMLAKQTNARIVNKSESHKNMSYNALTNLNLIYLYFANRFQDDKNDFFFFDYDLDNNLLGFFNPKKVLKLDVYNLLLQSTNSQHGLGPNGRKFYWNSLENYFEPINYDSNPFIDGDAPTTTTTLYRLPISEQFPKAFTELENKINSIDLTKLHNKVVSSGLNISKKDLENKINKILINLKKIETNYLDTDNIDLIEHNKFKPIDNLLTKLNETLEEIDPEVYLIKNSDGNMQRCSIYLENCEDYKFSSENLASLLEGELVLNEKVYQYLGKSLNFENIIKYRNYNKIEFNDTKIFYDDGIEIKTENKNILNIKQNKAGSRLYLIDGEIKNLTINFDGFKVIQNISPLNIKTFPDNYPIDINGLTGCLTLINIKVENVNVNANGSSCEDTVNLINVEGNLNEINIKNSFSDGLDVDFSNVKIEKINISSAINDCADFSAGVYQIGTFNLKNCGDKALSVGEKSLINLGEIIADNANIGVASKDSSIVKLSTANINNVKTCFAAYKKKQEFNGGFIDIQNMECKKYFRLADIDVHSKILNGKNILGNYLYGKTYDPEKLKISEVNGKPVIKNFLKDYKTFNKNGSVNVVIEIPAGTSEKWEVSKETGSLSRDFYMGRPRTIQYEPYPINYGMIPRTVLPARVGGDGDPLDVLVLGKPLTQGDVVQAQIIGMLKMTDFGEQDDKIIAVPLNGDLSNFENINELKNSKPEILENIINWLENYKGVNTVNFIKYSSANEAIDLVDLTETYYKRFGIRKRS